MPFLPRDNWRQRLFRQVDPLARLLVGAARRGRPPRRVWPTPNRILFMAIWAVGDVVMTIPALTTLRRAFPDASITVLGQPHAQTLLGPSNLVDHFVVSATPWAQRAASYHPRAYVANPAFRAMLRELRAAQFDLAIDGHMDPRSNILLWLTGAARRVGFSQYGGGAFLTDEAPLDPARPHTTEIVHQAVECVTGPQPMPPMRLVVPPDRRAAAKAAIDALALSPETRLVALHPGAGSLARRWGEERYAEIIRALRANRDRPTDVVVIAEPTGYGESLARATDSPVWRVSLADLVARLAWCDLFVGADNGPMHIAAAVDTPVVGLYGPTDIARYRPWDTRHAVVAVEPMPCRPCGDVCRWREQYCFTRLTPAMTLAAIDHVLAGDAPPRRARMGDGC
ncbi:MAG: glycosyltransferase family 9 protein [Dehalococcoidia bacterium]|nr:glycosyltransferase family 9 protein [Dehalococcoidia bacterium]